MIFNLKFLAQVSINIIAWFWWDSVLCVMWIYQFIIWIYDAGADGGSQAVYHEPDYNTEPMARVSSSGLQSRGRSRFSILYLLCGNVAKNKKMKSFDDLSKIVFWAWQDECERLWWSLGPSVSRTTQGHLITAPGHTLCLSLSLAPCIKDELSWVIDAMTSVWSRWHIVTTHDPPPHHENINSATFDLKEKPGGIWPFHFSPRYTFIMFRLQNQSL